MSLTLTEEQQRQMESTGTKPAEVVNPRTRRCYVLVPREECEALVVRAQQDAFTKASSRLLGRQLSEKP